MRTLNTPTTTQDSHTAAIYKATTIDGLHSRQLEAEAEDETIADEGDDSSADEEFAGFDEGEGGVSLVVDEESGKNEAKA